MIIFHLQWCGFVSGNHSEVVFSLRSFCFSLAGFAALSTRLFFLGGGGGIHRLSFAAQFACNYFYLTYFFFLLYFHLYRLCLYV